MQGKNDLAWRNGKVIIRTSFYEDDATDRQIVAHLCTLTSLHVRKRVLRRWLEIGMLSDLGGKDLPEERSDAPSSPRGGTRQRKARSAASATTVTGRPALPRYARKQWEGEDIWR